MHRVSNCHGFGLTIVKDNILAIISHRSYLSIGKYSERNRWSMLRGQYPIVGQNLLVSNNSADIVQETVDIKSIKV